MINPLRTAPRKSMLKSVKTKYGAKILDLNEIQDANFIFDSEIETRFMEKSFILSGYNFEDIAQNRASSLDSDLLALETARDDTGAKIYRKANYLLVMTDDEI